MAVSNAEQRRQDAKDASRARIDAINERQAALDAAQAERDEAGVVDVEALEADGAASATFLDGTVEVTTEEGVVHVVGRDDIAGFSDALDSIKEEE